MDIVKALWEKARAAGEFVAGIVAISAVLYGLSWIADDIFAHAHIHLDHYWWAYRVWHGCWWLIVPLGLVAAGRLWRPRSEHARVLRGGLWAAGVCWLALLGVGTSIWLLFYFTSCFGLLWGTVAFCGLLRSVSIGPGYLFELARKRWPLMDRLKSEICWVPGREADRKLARLSGRPIIPRHAEAFMPVEIIGEVGTSGAETNWIEAQGKLAIQHLKQVCGDPPPEMDLELVWQDHELGSYPVIALVWQDDMRGAPSNYLSRCEAALTAYENGGELPPGWSMPPVRSEDDDPNEPFDPDELPPEPPETLNVLEHQRYISKLIHWGFEASKRERSQPHLVERDDDDEDAS